jgi:hypothetical protein
MTMVTGKWQQLQKQRPHRQWKQQLSGSRETDSGAGCCTARHGCGESASPTLGSFFVRGGARAMCEGFI